MVGNSATVAGGVASVLHSTSSALGRLPHCHRMAAVAPNVAAVFTARRKGRCKRAPMTFSKERKVSQNLPDFPVGPIAQGLGDQ